MKHHRHPARTLPQPESGAAPSQPPATVEAPPVAVPLDRDALVREAAYFLYESRGGAPGHELEDWLRAEAEVERAAGDRGAQAADETAAA